VIPSPPDPCRPEGGTFLARKLWERFGGNGAAALEFLQGRRGGTQTRPRRRLTLHSHSTPSVDPLLALRPGLSKPRWHNLVLLVLALSIARTLVLWQVAVAVILPLRVDSAYQRLKRLLAWLTGDSPRLKQLWVGWVLAHFARAGQPLYLLIDWTFHTDRCRSLWVQLVAGGGRSLPLAFWLAANQFGGPGKQRAFADAALQQLHTWLPAGWSVILIGDRGFGGRDRMRFVQNLGWSFVFRITGDGRLGWRQRVRGRRGWRWRVRYTRVDAQPPAPGQQWRQEGVRYGRHGAIVLNLVAACLPLAPGQPASPPWYLATNLPTSVDVVAVYALRMQIEQSFRDYKAGLGLEQEYTRVPGERLEGLLLAVMIVAGREIWQGREGLRRTASAAVAETPTPAAAAAAAPGRRRYRVMSDGRRGWHEALTELVLGDGEIRQAVLAAAAKAQRMQQRRQVVTRRQRLPTKNRWRTRPAA
jgi:hypothetical protein